MLILKRGATVPCNVFSLFDGHVIALLGILQHDQSGPPRPQNQSRSLRFNLCIIKKLTAAAGAHPVQTPNQRRSVRAAEDKPQTSPNYCGNHSLARRPAAHRRGRPRGQTHPGWAGSAGRSEVRPSGVGPRDTKPMGDKWGARCSPILKSPRTRDF